MKGFKQKLANLTFKKDKLKSCVFPLSCVVPEPIYGHPPGETSREGRAARRDGCRIRKLEVGSSGLPEISARTTGISASRASPPSHIPVSYTVNTTKIV